MPKKDIKSALKNSLSVEEKSVQDRFEKAETLLGDNKGDDKKEISSGETETRPQQEKIKVVRDSFTMPQTDYELITALKKRSLESGIQTTKSEILRAGLLALNQMTNVEFISKIETVEKIKTGRPKQTV
ncbi:MAG: hypothetical protein M3388_16925 [Acidobacteriota bacterium]|nr:hypothetical protein [Acidobacteriota bacterium]